MTRAERKGRTGMDDLDKELHALRDVDVPQGLMGRVLDDALSMQPVPQPVAEPLWRRVAAALGGWQSFGGLVAATCAGFWIGIAPPSFLPASAEVLLGVASYEDTAELGSFGWALEETE